MHKTFIQNYDIKFKFSAILSVYLKKKHWVGTFKIALHFMLKYCSRTSHQVSHCNAISWNAQESKKFWVIKPLSTVPQIASFELTATSLTRRRNKEKKTSNNKTRLAALQSSGFNQKAFFVSTLQWDMYYLWQNVIWSHANLLPGTVKRLPALHMERCDVVVQAAACTRVKQITPGKP